MGVATDIGRISIGKMGKYDFALGLHRANGVEYVEVEFKKKNHFRFFVFLVVFGFPFFFFSVVVFP